MIVKCSVCGKKIDVTWPHLWTYKRGSSGGYAKYMCSYSCLRAYDDMKGMNQDMSLSKEQRQTVIDMAMRGESPLTYIEEQGIKNPSCTWWNIRKYMEKNDPETYAKLPAKFKGAKVMPKQCEQVETPEGNATVAATKKEPKKSELGYRVTAIKLDDVGEFYHDEKYGCIDWRTPGGDEVSLPIGDWKALPETIKAVLKALGV